MTKTTMAKTREKQNKLHTGKIFNPLYHEKIFKQNTNFNNPKHATRQTKKTNVFEILFTKHCFVSKYHRKTSREYDFIAKVILNISSCILSDKSSNAWNAESRCFENPQTSDEVIPASSSYTKSVNTSKQSYINATPNIIKHN